MQCVICEVRPAMKGGAYCHTHQAQIEAERKARRGNRDWWRGAFKFAVWRGVGVAFMPNGEKGVYQPKALPASALGHLPKGKTINLDGYVNGLSREQVKRIKRAILQANGQ